MPVKLHINNAVFDENIEIHCIFWRLIRTCNLPESIQCFDNRGKRLLDPYSSRVDTENLDPKHS